MKGIITHGNGDIKLADLPEPKIGPYDCLVRIDSCLFCNSTDAHIIHNNFNFGIPYPTILGHESIGRVVECGSSVRNFSPGDLVTRPYALYPDETLGDYGSGWGGFAEYGKIRDHAAMVADGLLARDQVPGFFLYMQKVPANLPIEEVRLITCLREIYSATRKIPDIRDKSFLITGAGIAGLLFARFLKLHGAGKITIAARRQEALDFALAETPADGALLFSDDRDETFDAIVETTGSPDVLKETSRRFLQPDGGIFSYAIYPGETDSSITYRRIDPAEHTAHEEICDLIADGSCKVGHWITHTFAPKEATAAWQTIREKRTIKTAVLF